MGWTMAGCPRLRWGCHGWIRGKWVSKIVERDWCTSVYLTSYYQMCPYWYVFLSLCLCSFFTFPTMSTAGPFPVVKQEQLSPRSSSSQADNLSTQGTSHEGASGRGKWLSCSFIQFVYMVYLSWGLVSIFLVPCSELTMILPASRGNVASQVYFSLFFFITFFPT